MDVKKMEKRVSIGQECPHFQLNRGLTTEWNKW